MSGAKTLKRVWSVDRWKEGERCRAKDAKVFIFWKICEDALDAWSLCTFYAPAMSGIRCWAFDVRPVLRSTRFSAPFASPRDSGSRVDPRTMDTAEGGCSMFSQITSPATSPPPAHPSCVLWPLLSGTIPANVSFLWFRGRWTRVSCSGIALRVWANRTGRA
jgi:hypothetical protein